MSTAGRRETPESCINPKERFVRWSGANLFRNPFGELTRQERIELARVDSAPVHALLRNEDGYVPRVAFQYVGDCGRGKSSRLLGLVRELEDCVYVYLPEDAPCPAIPRAGCLMIDEAQRLPRRVRSVLFGSGISLVLATHRDLSAQLRRHGYRVVTEDISLELDAGSLAEILNLRISASRRDANRPIPVIGLQSASNLMKRFGTDVRAMELHLYDLVQGQVDSHGEMRFDD